MTTGKPSSFHKSRQHIKKQRHYFANKSLHSLYCSFSSSHVLIWETIKKADNWCHNWCFWTVVLEKTFESPLYCKEIKPVNSEENQSWIFIGRTKVEAEAPMLWPLVSKDPNAGKVWRQEDKGTTEDEMVGWHHWLNGHELAQALGDDEGQRSLTCCIAWGRKVLEMTEWLNSNMLVCIGLLKISFEFFQKMVQKTQMNFLANPIF